MNYRASIAAVLLATSGYAISGELPSTFEAFDKDGNGYISMDEASAGTALSENFKTSDTNSDGKLDSAEFSAFEGQGRLSPPEDSEIPEPGAAPY
jgi:hypothetical protein